MIRDIKHIGLVNPEHVVSVNAYRAWRNRRVIKRKYLFWGKPERSKDCFDNWWYPAHVTVRFSGGSTCSIQCKSNAQAERVRDEIVAELNGSCD